MIDWFHTILVSVQLVGALLFLFSLGWLLIAGRNSKGRFQLLSQGVTPSSPLGCLLMILLAGLSMMLVALLGHFILMAF